MCSVHPVQQYRYRVCAGGSGSTGWPRDAPTFNNNTERRPTPSQWPGLSSGLLWTRRRTPTPIWVSILLHLALDSRVADPYSFGSRSGSRGFDDQKLKRNYSWKKILFTIYLSLGLHKGHLSYRRSLQLSSGSTYPIESGSNSDPDPPPC